MLQVIRIEKQEKVLIQKYSLQRKLQKCKKVKHAMQLQVEENCEFVQGVEELTGTKKTKLQNTFGYEPQSSAGPSSKFQKLSRLQGCKASSGRGISET